MFSSEELKEARDHAICKLEHGAPHAKIRIESLPEKAAGEINGMEDEEGDKIEASSVLQYELAVPKVAVVIQPGLSPQEVVRILRKIISMFSESNGSELANLGTTEYGPDRAARLWTGELYFYNSEAEINRQMAEDSHADGLAHYRRALPSA